ADAAVEDQVIANFERPVLGPVDQDRRARQIDDRVLVQVRKALDSVFVQRKRHAQAQHSMRLEQLVSLVKGAPDGSGYMFEDVAGQYEIVGSVTIRVRFGNIEPRLSIVERVDVVELFREEARVAQLIAGAQTFDTGQPREI